MNNCSICGWAVAWCVDKEDKGTYWLCGRCAVEDVTEFIVKERVLVRVARAAKELWSTSYYHETYSFIADEFHEALEALPDGLLEE